MLTLGPSRVRQIKVADGRTLPVSHKTLPFTITMGTLTSTLRAPVTEVEGFDIVLGLDWLRQNKPHVNWATSTLTISQEGVHHKVYPETVDQLMRDHIFVRITETQEEQEDLSKIDYSTCTFERIHFCNATLSPTRFANNHFRIVKAHPFPSTIARPRPVPLPTPFVVKNGSKIFARVSSDMPDPSSATVSRA